MQLITHDALSFWTAYKRGEAPKSFRPRGGRMFCVQAKRGDDVLWTGYFDGKGKSREFWHALQRTNKTLPFELRHLPVPAFDEWLRYEPNVTFYWFGTQALTGASSSVQTWTVDATWNSTNNKVEVIAPGGNGAARQSTTIGGCGGGAGEYTNRSNVALTPGGSMYYLLPAGGSVVDAWANDLNLLLQSDGAVVSPWVAARASVAAGLSDPAGGTSAWSLTEDTTASNTHVRTQFNQAKVAASTSINCSFYAKPNGRRIAIDLCSGSDVNGITVCFDLAGGQIGAAAVTFGTGWSSPAASITTDSVATGAGGNGYYLCTVSGTSDALATIGVNLSLDNGTGTQTFSQIYTGNGTSGVTFYGMRINYGTAIRPYTPTTTTQIYSNLSKAGTNATTTAAGVHQTGGQGDTVNEGGDGFKPGTGVAIGGGGGGAAGPSGPGTTSAGSTGGAADNGTVTQPTATNANGVAGTEFGTQGSGTGASGRSGNGGGFTGGLYGGGGSGTGTQASQIGGTGAQAIIFLTWVLAATSFLGSTLSFVTPSDPPAPWLAASTAKYPYLVFVQNPVIAKQWRWDFVEPTFWQGRPSTKYSLLGGQVQTKLWRWDFVDPTVWSVQSKSKPIFLGGQVPTKRWSYDWAEDFFWAGRSISPPQFLGGKVLSRLAWNFGTGVDTAWQFSAPQPRPPSTLTSPFYSTQWAFALDIPTFWVGKPMAIYSANIPSPPVGLLPPQRTLMGTGV